MSIAITVTTVTDRIANEDGDNGYGWVHLRPYQPFSYNDGSATVEVGTQTISIEVADGQLQDTLTLHPTKNATHSPETFYEVVYDIDGATWKQYFSVDASPTTIEWGDIQRLAGPTLDAEDATLLAQHEDASNPHPQYARYDESTDATPGAGVATSRGTSFFVRVVLATGKIAKSFLNLASLPSISSDRLLGRDTAGSGDVEELTVGGGIEFTGSGGIQRSALTGDVTASAGSAATTIANAAVTLAKMANLGANTLIGRATASTGVPEAVTLGGDLEMSGGALRGKAFTGDVTRSAGGTALTLADNTVTAAKMNHENSFAIMGYSAAGVPKAAGFVAGSHAVSTGLNAAVGDAGTSYDVGDTNRQYFGFMIESFGGGGSPEPEDYNIKLLINSSGRCYGFRVERIKASGTPDVTTTANIRSFYLDVS